MLQIIWYPKNSFENQTKQVTCVPGSTAQCAHGPAFLTVNQNAATRQPTWTVFASTDGASRCIISPGDTATYNICIIMFTATLLLTMLPANV